MASIPRPRSDEYAPYYGLYIDRVGEGDVLEILEAELAKTVRLLSGVTEQVAGSRYEPGKWTVRDTVGHLIDTERLFTYRALSFARGDAGPLPSMEQDQWAREAAADGVPLTALTAELGLVRGSTIALFRRFAPETLTRRGTASGVEFSVRSFAFIVAGHEIHHRAILETRYGLAEA